ncbi:hypothetical protein BH780_gp138 [Bacillus phage Eldridge]|uniref:Uncharacterized protein n=1 Tax=Bacillus phage Eldridge TaxID=1776293 RepID=A0A0Y0ASG8_9CAUD|nr:hypothetical protein BH780_gp138 [Bacillus phage Eldridge]AMB18721.1 hypothetical protein Eldridge_0141 [Bacillus phage Eldridge]
MNEEQNKLIDLDKNKLEYHRQGTLFIQGVPTYIIDMVKEGDLLYVIVYAADSASKEPRKAYTLQRRGEVPRFSSNTRLGVLANTLFPPKKQQVRVDNPPVFVAPVIPRFTNTFTGKEESGFFEREPDKLTTVAGERTLQRGKNTGVFIGLSSIVWDEKYTIPTKSLVDALIRHQQADGFYDFTDGGDNKDNPLGRNYQGGE